MHKHNCKNAYSSTYFTFSLKSVYSFAFSLNKNILRTMMGKQTKDAFYLPVGKRVFLLDTRAAEACTLLLWKWTLGQRVGKSVCERPRGPDHGTKSSDSRKRIEPGLPVCPRRSGHPLTVVLHRSLPQPATAPAASHRLTVCRALHASFPLPPA